MCKQLHDIIKLFRLTLHVVNGKKKKIRLPTDLSVTFDAFLYFFQIQESQYIK